MRLEPNPNRYPAVRILIAIIRLAAAIPAFLGIFGILAGGTELFRQKSGLPLLLAVAISIGPLLLGLVLFAASECLRILIDIENNTRATAEEIALLPLSIGSRDQVHNEQFQSR